MSQTGYTLSEIPLYSATWSVFETLCFSACKEIVDRLKPTSCQHDIVPSHFFKQNMGAIGSGLLSVINKCLYTGTVPVCLKQAVITPYIKKPNLDPSSLSSFRPISNLPFISKIMEKAVLAQLQTFLSNNSINEVFQSGFKALHSTESALLRVLNYTALKDSLHNISPVWSHSSVGKHHLVPIRPTPLFSEQLHHTLHTHIHGPV